MTSHVLSDYHRLSLFWFAFDASQAIAWLRMHKSVPRSKPVCLCDIVGTKLAIVESSTISIVSTAAGKRMERACCRESVNLSWQPLP